MDSEGKVYCSECIYLSVIWTGMFNKDQFGSRFEWSSEFGKGMSITKGDEHWICNCGAKTKTSEENTWKEKVVMDVTIVDNPEKKNMHNDCQYFSSKILEITGE